MEKRLLLITLPRHLLDESPLVLKRYVKFEVQDQLEMVHTPLKNPGGRRDVVLRRPLLLHLQSPLLLLQVLAQVTLQRINLTYRRDN